MIGHEYNWTIKKWEARKAYSHETMHAHPFSRKRRQVLNGGAAHNQEQPFNGVPLSAFLSIKTTPLLPREGAGIRGVVSRLRKAIERLFLELFL